MEIRLFMAPSFNGIIAHSNGSEDFVSGHAWEVHEKLAANVGAIIVGRKTIEAVESWNDPNYSFEAMSVKTRIAVSSDPTFQKPGWIAATSPESAISHLKEKGYSAAHLVGGATLAGSFFNKKLVSKVYLLLQPWLVSEGTPIVKELRDDIQLEVLSVEKLTEDEVFIETNVKY